MTIPVQRFVGTATACLLLGAAAASAASGPIPWLNKHPVKASANPPLAAPCSAASLHAHLFLQGATGSLVGGVSLRNAGTRACSLLGRPTVSFAGGGADATSWQVKKLPASQVPPDVLADPPGSLRALAPGKSAGVTIFWSNWCGPNATPTGDPGEIPARLDLMLADGTTVVIPVAHAPRCDQPQAPSTISVTPFAPTVRHLPEKSRLPLRARIVGEERVVLKPGLHAFSVRRGQLLHFSVALTNTGKTAFHFADTSCPTYVEQVAPAAAQLYVLNCRPVAAIAPRRTVVFAMQVAVPTQIHAGTNSLTWTLAPKTYLPPFTSAALAVAANGAKVSPPVRAMRWIQMIDSTHGYALSGQGVYDLLSTADGGRDWTNVTPGKGTAHPSGPLSIFGSTRLFSRKLGRHTFAVVRSTDGGRTWRQSRPFVDPFGLGVGQPFAIDARHLFLGVGEGAAAGSEGQALFTSGDGGEHWSFVSRTSHTPPLRGALPMGCDKNGFAFTTQSSGWAGGDCAGGPPFLYRTLDGGHTWQRQKLAAPRSCACNTSTPAFFSARDGAFSVTGFAGFAAHRGGQPFARVFWTHDGGDHWQAGAPLPVGRVARVAFADARSVWVVAARQGRLSLPFDRLVRSDDGGLHWQSTRLPFDGGDYWFDALSSMTAFGVEFAGVSNTIVVTHDGGRTWTTIHARVA